MDNQQLVDTVTKIIMEQLRGAGASCPTTPSVVTFGDVPACVLGSGAAVRKGTSPSDADGADYIVLTQAAFRAFHGGAIPAGLTGMASAAAATASPVCRSCSEFDLTGKKVIGERDVRALTLSAGASVRIDAKALVTALARDYVHSQGATIVR
ncbi:MAG: hypothetical protein FWF75_02055 [Propionibacteriaceae bacterium]|nr:hypothetical protein [Propionibacteriaceae bacterium]